MTRSKPGAAIAAAASLSMLALAAPLSAAPVPPDVAAMIAAAAPDPAALKLVSDIARKAHPGSTAEIDAMVAGIEAKVAADQAAKLASQGFLEGWRGEGQAGAFASSGNTSDSGIALGLALKKESRHWRHGIEAIADWQRSDGETSKERFFLGYNGNYKFADRLYAWLLLSAERDRFAGFNSRFAEGVGLGWRAIESKRVTLDLEGGPALRQTSFIDLPNENSLALRLAETLEWRLAPTTSLTQSASAFIEGGNSTLTLATALTARISGALAARAGFELRHETEPPPGREPTDTTTRFTLVYDF